MVESRACPLFERNPLFFFIPPSKRARRFGRMWVLWKKILRRLLSRLSPVWFCRAVTKHVPDAIGFSPIIRFTVRLIASRSAHLRFSATMPLLTPIELSSTEKLEILQRLDRYRKWHSLEDKETLPRKASARPREKLSTRFRKFAVHFRSAA